MVLCVGEILADMLGSRRDGMTVYEQKAGGAPFNVACGVKQFGAQSAFVGSVGDDLVGDFLTEFAASRNLDGLYLRRDRKHNTTLAFVQIDARGERSFCFYRKNTADFHLPRVPKKLLDRADIVHVGSLMLSDGKGRAYALELISRARQMGKIVSFDVNFRTDIFRNEQEAIEIFRLIISLADIVKFSEEEVSVFGKTYVESLGEKLVCITLGERGSMWRFRGRDSCVSTINVRPVDTTGAGDAFYAGVLAQLDGTVPDAWDAERLDAALAYGNVCGALNTLGRGAIEHLPEKEEVLHRLQMNGREMVT